MLLSFHHPAPNPDPSNNPDLHLPPLLPLSFMIISSPRYLRDNFINAPGLSPPELDALESEPPTTLHHLEDPFDAGDAYVPLPVHEAASLNPLIIVARPLSARPLSTSQPFLTASPSPLKPSPFPDLSKVFISIDPSPSS
jgi:hypothetical protein